MQTPNLQKIKLLIEQERPYIHKHGKDCKTNNQCEKFTLYETWTNHLIDRIIKKLENL